MAEKDESNARGARFDSIRIDTDLGPGPDSPQGATGIGTDTYGLGSPALPEGSLAEGGEDEWGQDSKGMSYEDTLAETYLGGARYPATRDDLIEYARQGGAPDNVIMRLESLPNRKYGGWNDIYGEF